ncbi:hypothetical protein [Spirosoma arcticum]
MFSLYPPDLDATQRENIAGMHKDNLDRLNQLASWTDDDFDLAVQSSCEWFANEQDWLISWENAKRLITDPRAPVAKATELFERWEALGIERIKSARPN